MFLLRIEDIDGTRSRAEHVAGIIEDLEWLGLSWDGSVMFQSGRLGAYEAALARLRGMGLLYPCFCTRADIAASVSAPHGDGGVAYPGTCRGVDPSGRMEEPNAWRLDVARALKVLPCAGEDLVWFDDGNPIDAVPHLHDDVVLARKDAPASYHLAVTVDDAAQGVTDVVRGEDLFAATHVHRLLQALLGVSTPLYHHHPLLADANGQRLAKRHNAPTLAELRASGIDGRALAAGLREGRLPIGFAVANA
ncbi:tRNA glutamyl-Q(34) synthetase GluQRS [soil metagenome]